MIHHFGAGEDAGECVVVALGDRLELVIVATGASDGEAEHRARDGIDAILPFIGHHFNAVTIVIFRAEAKETYYEAVLFISGVLNVVEADEVPVCEL